MNIISGRFKGYKINTSFNTNYRPTKSSVRKSLFEKLKSLKNKKVLDLFAGTGVMGFEASSRGADSISFVENNSCLLYTSPSPRDVEESRMPSSA